jgi:L-ribulose-5-phosphate 4-epimerase
MMKALKQRVCKANRDLVSTGLVTLTWGNVSGIDRERGLVVIKPSGVPYEDLKPQQMVVVDLEGKVIEGDLRPSSDTPTHVALYRAFPNIGGIVHTHSRNATIFSQARREIPCLGTTHADHFHGPVPVTRPLTEQEVADDYEGNTGTVIVERFAGLDPDAMPAVLVAGHAPFAWGPTVERALDNAIALEAVAEMAIATRSLEPDSPELEFWVLEKHHQRKHGPAAYYGQK